MKKIIPLISISLLTLSGAVAICLSINSDKATEVRAEVTTNTICGLYERIEDESEVTPGTKVILATTSGYIFDGIGGNPAYAHGDPGGVTKIGDYTLNTYYDDWRNYYCPDDTTKFLWIDENKPAIELTVESGSTAYSSDYPLVSFKASFNICGQTYNHYLGENDEERNQRDDYQGVAWFLDGFGCRKEKDGKSTWELRYDANEKHMLIRKVLYDDETSFIVYNYSGVRHHFCFGSADNAGVNLYRKVLDENIVRPVASMGPVVHPTKTAYRLGEKVDYTGMFVEFRINRTGGNFDDHLVPYDSVTSGLFTEPKIVTSIYSQITFKIFDLVQYTFPITIVSTGSNNVFNYVQTMMPDLRGTYLLVMNNDRLVDLSRSTGSTSNYYDYDHYNKSGNSIIASDVDEYNLGQNVDKSAIRIVRTKIGDNYYYHAKNVNDQYLCLGEQVDDKNEYYIAYTDSATVSNAVTMTNSYLSINGYRITNSERSKLVSFTQHGDTSSFYKLAESTTSISEEISSFIQFFLNKTSVCSNPDEDSEFDKISNELWSDIEVEFEKLSPDAQGTFASTTYNHNAEELETKENVADRYDYILSKYNKKDFMLRKLADTYINYYSANRQIFIFNNIDGSTNMFIIVLALVSITTLAFLILIKRRKHQ